MAAEPLLSLIALGSASAAVVALGAGALAGLLHALSGPDHLAAVAPLSVSGDRATRVGFGWGIGHTLGVWGVGAAALLVRTALPIERFSSWSERLVGAVLIGIGLWGLLRTARKLADPQGTSPHHHPEIEPSAGRPLWTAVSVGTLHGFAGSSHVLGVLPALALPDPLSAGGYLFGFGVGTVAGMAFAATLLGRLAAKFTPRGHLRLLATLSVLAIGVGVYWLVA